MLHVLILFWKYIVHIYIYRPADSILTAFKIQDSISVEGMHNRRICANEDREILHRFWTEETG